MNDIALKTFHALDHFLLRRDYKQSKNVLLENLDGGKYGAARECLERLIAFKQREEFLRLMNDGKTYYIVNTWLLYDSYRLLMKCPVESIHYLAGINVGRAVIPMKIVGFDMEHQSAIRARGESISSFQALRMMDGNDNKFVMYVHSHPGNGKGAVYPSNIDEQYQKRLENGGYSAIGCIFSRDGWFRFFTRWIQADVLLTGSEGRVVCNGDAARLTEI